VIVTVRSVAPSGLYAWLSLRDGDNAFYAQVGATALRPT